MVIFSWDVSTFTYLQSTMNYVKYRVWGVTFECECWCWCHRVKVGSWWGLITVNSVHTCFLSVRLQHSVMFISNPPPLIWRKFLALLSGEVVRFLHPPPHLRWKCFLLRIDRIGRELKVDGSLEKTNYTEDRNIKYTITCPVPAFQCREIVMVFDGDGSMVWRSKIK